MLGRYRYPRSSRKRATRHIDASKPTLVDRAVNSVTHFVPSAASPTLEKLTVYPIRFAFLPWSDDAGNEMSVTELTARPTRWQTRLHISQGLNSMLKKQLPVILGSLMVSVMVASCSSGGTNGTTAETADGVVPPLSVNGPPVSPPMPVGNVRVLFPEMQGSWARGCLLFDEEEPSEGYEHSVITITDNEFLIDTKIYSDSNCVVPLARGFLQFGDDFQSYGTLQRPEGSANTSVGAVPFVNIDFTRFTIENEPLVPAAAALNTPYTDYSIVYVDGDQMYLGDPDVPGQSGDSAQTRAVTLDFEDPLTRQ